MVRMLLFDELLPALYLTLMLSWMFIVLAYSQQNRQHGTQ